MRVLADGRVRRSEAEWRSILGRFEKSGLSGPTPARVLNCITAALHDDALAAQTAKQVNVQTRTTARKFPQATSTARLRRRLFGRPALPRKLTRYQQIRRRSAASWTDSERAYVELRDLADTCPKGLATALDWFVADAAKEQTDGAA